LNDAGWRFSARRIRRTATPRPRVPCAAAP
jgi:hypothetical protein